MDAFDTTVTALNRYITDAERIERAQIDRDCTLTLGISGTTWCKLTRAGLQTLYALDDPNIPLAQWASQKPPRRILVLAYRPNKRLVIKDLDRKRIIKGYRRGKSKKPATKHQLAEETLTSIHGIRAPKLIRHNSSLSALELEFCNWGALHITQAPPEDLTRVGYALARWQLTTPASSSLPLWTAELELQALAKWRAKVTAVGVEIPTLWHQIYNQLSQQLPTATTLVLTHRDMHDGQFLRSTPNLCLLDFDSLSLADSMLDLANFASHIDLRYIQRFKPDTCASQQRRDSLLKGYTNTAALHPNAFCWYQATTLLRLALVYAIRPRWRHITSKLTSRAKTIVQENSTLEA